MVRTQRTTPSALTRILPAIIAVALLATGCRIDWALLTPDDPLPNPPIDFARALELGILAFDVTPQDNSDAALIAKYQTSMIDVYVGSAVFPGDDGASRYMLLSDREAQRHTLVLGGTATRVQWQFDSDVELVEDAEFNARVHRGWRSLALLVFDDVLPRLDPNYAITISGYSLGGAVSCLVGEALIHDSYNVDEIVTFGQPRITDAVGAEAFGNLPLTRFANVLDPFAFTQQGEFRHFGRVIILFEGQYFAYMPADDPGLQLGGRPLDTFKPTDAQNHLPFTYIRHLRQKLTAPIEVKYAPGG